MIPDPKEQPFQYYALMLLACAAYDTWIRRPELFSTLDGKHYAGAGITFTRSQEARP